MNLTFDDPVANEFGQCAMCAQRGRLQRKLAEFLSKAKKKNKADFQFPGKS